MSQRVYGYSSTVSEKRRRRKRRRRIKHIAVCISVVLIVCAGTIVLGKGIEKSGVEKSGVEKNGLEKNNDKIIQTGVQKDLQAKGYGKEKNYDEFLEENYPEELKEMLEKNPQTYEFVKGYSERSKYQGKDIDITGDVMSGKIPLFLQWDMRWGYDYYGNEMIGLAGCGPTCMSMAYVYLTEDTNMNPRKMAEFANDKGYYTKVGTSWDFFTDGARELGLQGAEIGLDEVKMKEVLDNGKLIICSMRPGDFTTTGHIILICGYDEKGFRVNDPNSEENSEKQWAFDRISYQIKCLWSISK